jgi:hypothetical protein
MTYKKKRRVTDAEILETAVLMSLYLAKNERNYILAYYGIGEGEAAVVREISNWAKELEESVEKYYWEEVGNWYEDVEEFVEKKLEQYKTVWLVRGNKVLNYRYLGLTGKFTAIDNDALPYNNKGTAIAFTKKQKHKGLKVVEAFRDRYGETNILP